MRKLHPNTLYFPVPGDSRVYEETEFLKQMAMKFFLHELIDCFDLLSMLAILGITRGIESGLGASIPMGNFWRCVVQIVIELALEIVFISLTKLVIQRKYPSFQPFTVRSMQRGAIFLEENWVQVMALIGATFPTTFALALVFQPDLANTILSQLS
jgi:hypothetical protein